MPDTLHNPALNPAIAGHARRFVIKSVDVVHARVDQQTKDVLVQLKKCFAGAKRRDTISTSMLFRRAMAVYRQHVNALGKDARTLQAERALLTQSTYLPKGGGAAARTEKPSDCQ